MKVQDSMKPRNHVVVAMLKAGKVGGVMKQKNHKEVSKKDMKRGYYD